MDDLTVAECFSMIDGRAEANGAKPPEPDTAVTDDDLDAAIRAAEARGERLAWR